MKTLTKFLTLGLMLAAFAGISVSSANAQTVEECEAIYQKFLAGRKGPEIPQFEASVAAGDEYVSKCSALPGQEEVLKYVNTQLPKVKTALGAKKDEVEIYTPFNKSVPAKDWATAFQKGKLVIGKNPDDVDVPLVLASIGFDLSVANPPVDTYNADAISMAKLALQKMEEGKGSGTGNFGAFVYTYKTTVCADGKTNAMGWMNYTIGNIMFTRMNQKKEALPYFYKATQVGCDTKDRIANVYRTIGSWYVDEFRRIEGEKNAAYTELEKLKTDDPTFADAKKKYEDLVALQKGYMERVMDAYARAYNAAVKAKETPAFTSAQLNRAKEFYGFRNGGKQDGFDAWLSGINSKPFVDPTSAVTPIVEAEPTTAPTAMTTTTDTPASTGTDTRARTVATGTSADKTTTATTTAAKTTTKAPAKKPAAKKKGTR